jgi:D-alanyl-D-alanine carboxypeptidase (penicillin-binding protein 5/6)
MTAYVAMNRLGLGEEVVAPPYAAAGPESLLGRQGGEVTSVRDLIYALVLASANDGAVALAEAAAGDVDRFVAMMNREAERLGMGETTYENPVGFDAPGSGSSARDLAKLARVLLSDRFFARVADTETRTVHTDGRDLEIETRNTLLSTHPWVTGVKTGYTLGAGYVLVGSGARKDVRLISVVLGAPTEDARDSETLELLDYGFSLYRRAEPVRKGQTFVSPEVDSGGSLPLVARSSALVSVRRGQGVETSVQAPAELAGPIDRGERLGEVTVLVGGREAARVPLVAGRSAPAPTLPDRFENAVGAPAWVAVAGVGLIVIVIALLLFRRLRSANADG